MFVRILDWLLVLGALAGFVLLGAWAVYQSPDNAAVLEAQLQQKTESALYATGQDWASVEMDGQHVILHGAAPSMAAADRAKRTVLAADGAGGLIIGGVTKVEIAIADAPLVSPFVWTATKTDDGQIILTGHVPSELIRESLLGDAEGLAPGNTDNRMQIGAGAPSGDWQSVARLGLRQFVLIETGTVRLEDTRLSVSGIAMDDAARIQASAEVANVAAPYSGEPNIIGSSLWAARHETEGLLLTGKVANETERSHIADIARQYYSGEVLDEMIVTDQDYEGWMDGVELGLPHFSKFRSGEMGFNPEGVGFTFEGEASGSTLAYLQEDMAKLAGPYNSEIKVETVLVEVAEIADIDFAGDALASCQAAFEAVLGTNKVYFASGNSEITRESGATLDKLMAVSAQCDPALIFEIGGHTDNQGERTFNIWLSQERAKAVADYMTARGFEGRRLFAVGHGPDLPAATNGTRAGRSANRRIEFTVKNGNE